MSAADARAGAKESARATIREKSSCSRASAYSCEWRISRSFSRNSCVVNLSQFTMVWRRMYSGGTLPRFALVTSMKYPERSVVFYAKVAYARAFLLRLFELREPRHVVARKRPEPVELGVKTPRMTPPSWTLAGHVVGERRCEKSFALRKIGQRFGDFRAPVPARFEQYRAGCRESGATVSRMARSSRGLRIRFCQRPSMRGMSLICESESTRRPASSGEE